MRSVLLIVAAALSAGCESGVVPIDPVDAATARDSGAIFSDAAVAADASVDSGVIFPDAAVAADSSVDAGPPSRPVLYRPAISTVSAGRGALELTLYGDAFTPATTAEWNGAIRQITWIDSQTLNIHLTAEDLATPGVAEIAVMTPGAGRSTVATITVVAPAQPGTFAQCNRSTAGADDNGLNGVIEIAISGDGRLCLFTSDGSNLVSNDTNAAYDVFAHDVVSGVTEAISVDNLGALRTGMSPRANGDGRFVVFMSGASFPGWPSNGQRQAYLRDRLLQQTSLISFDAASTPANSADDVTSLAINADGSRIVFGTRGVFQRAGASGIYLFDRSSNTTTELLRAVSHNLVISADGRLVFLTTHDALSPLDLNSAADVYVVTATGGPATLLTLSGPEGLGISLTGQDAVSDDGRYVGLFDANGYRIRDRQLGLDFVSSSTAAWMRGAALSMNWNAELGAMSLFVEKGDMRVDDGYAFEICHQTPAPCGRIELVTTLTGLERPFGFPATGSMILARDGRTVVFSTIFRPIGTTAEYPLYRAFVAHTGF